MSSQLCVKCVLPSTTPGISFDKNGVCNYCNTYIPMKVGGEQKLIKILDSYKNRKGAKYDCMVCISGGRDSAYTLWKIVHDYKLRVLAVNYKNPFTSEQAKLNLQSLVKKLGVDFYDWEFPNDIHRKSTEKALKAWSHHPTSTLIPILCGYCKTIWPTLYKIAQKHEIPLIVVGSNPLETASFKKAGIGGARYYYKLTMLPTIISKSLKELIKNPRYLTHCSWSLILKMYLYAGQHSPLLRRRFNNIEVVRLFDYILWNEKEVLHTIEKNLDWKKAPEVESSWRFDCELDYGRRIMYGATIGVTELVDLFSKMIREKILTRDEALRRLEKENVVPKEKVNEVLSRVGTTLEDLNLPEEYIRELTE